VSITYTETETETILDDPVTDGHRVGVYTMHEVSVNMMH
jgi:hypothetical protein